MHYLIVATIMNLKRGRKTWQDFTDVEGIDNIQTAQVKDLKLPDIIGKNEAKFNLQILGKKKKKKSSN